MMQHGLVLHMTITKNKSLLVITQFLNIFSIGFMFRSLIIPKNKITLHLRPPLKRLH
jgi:hypothetical protein